MTSKKIVVRLIGGLGNQLFGYAAARRLAIVNDAELVIDNLSGFLYDHQYRRAYQLGHFNIPCRLALPAERLEPLSRIRRFIKKLVNKNRPFDKKNYIQQDVFDFDERLLSLRPQGDITIEGYWQSEYYFRDIEAQLRQDLEITPPDDLLNKNMRAEITQKQAVAVHYRFFSTQDAADNLSRDYYLRAITRIRQSVALPHFFIFSDKPDRAAKQLPLDPDEVTFVNINHGDESAYADLWLMKQCRHFIIANSTFSWWGAWLSPNPDKTVIAPGLLKRTGLSWWGFKGLVPASWVTLDP